MMLQSTRMTKNIDTIEHKLQTELGNANTCSKQNKLQLNYGKTTCMILVSRPHLKECRLLILQADNTNNQNVNAQKLLGFYVDKQLSWSEHKCLGNSSDNTRKQLFTDVLMMFSLYCHENVCCVLS